MYLEEGQKLCQSNFMASFSNDLVKARLWPSFQVHHEAQCKTDLLNGESNLLKANSSWMKADVIHF